MMATLAVCTYFPEVAEALDTDWNGITGAFIITFFIFHTMAILLIELYSTIVVSLMLPSSPANASHLMIEEALPAALIDDKLVGPGDTDEDPTPGLAKRFLAKFRQIVEAYRRTRCRTLLRIDDDPITTVRTVEYTCVRYRYDSTIEAFAPAAEGMKVTPAQARQRLLNGGLSMEECSNLQRLIGRNEIGVQLPSVFMSLVDEFSTVFYVIQSTLCVKSSGSSDDEAVMIVSAIGGLTAKGKMVRIVMFPEPVRFKYHDQLPLVYLGLFLYALLLSVAYFVFTRIGNWVVTILQVMVAVKQSINPMLPVAMIFCLQPERIPVAGKISVMVFDKTGTITKDGMELVGVLPAQGGKLGNRLDMASPSTPSTLAGTLLSKCGDTDGLTEELHRGLACCHSVIRLRDGSLSGDQVEIAMFNASGWTISDKGEVVITSPDGCTELSVLRHMHFQRETMTSGCIVQTGITSDCHNSRSLTVFVKGSPESIMKCCTTVPDVYMKACEELAAENLYVLAMASKNLSVKVTAGDLTDMKRSDLETGLSLQLKC
ncbi:hypothetical protein FOL47_000846 [Perkinsus chesapeaki]|uniref:Cation-transporting atpase n=1 Tax=Perkinsus chesapeaki TaxID=330153 RepID=A0A7J6KW17_PERCH|nr:hypothetical protein FOL47_000846 [Perkinsus chesapeaki]